jgi:hypothetical protein
MIPSKDTLYAIVRFCADKFEEAIWSVFPEQSQAEYEADTNRLIASIFPNGTCQSCVYAEREGEQ